MERYIKKVRRGKVGWNLGTLQNFPPGQTSPTVYLHNEHSLHSYTSDSLSALGHSTLRQLHNVNSRQSTSDRSQRIKVYSAGRAIVRHLPPKGFDLGTAVDLPERTKLWMGKHNQVNGFVTKCQKYSETPSQLCETGNGESHRGMVG